MKASEFIHTDLALVLHFGHGKLIVQGTHTAEDNLPAIAVYELDEPGVVGTPAPIDTPRTLRLVLTFPTMEQAKAVFSAMAPAYDSD